MTEETAKNMIAAIIALSNSVDELVTEIQDVRDAVHSLDETIKTTEFHD